VETLKEDLSYILRYFDLDAEANDINLIVNREQELEVEAQKYFQRMRTEIQNGIFNLFKHDLNLFDYSAKNYI